MSQMSIIYFTLHLLIRLILIMSIKNKVSVIISIYKNDNPVYFKEALDSILAQTYGIENINIYQAVDGNISDELEAVLDNYSPYFHKIIRIDNNEGLANALNELIRSLENEEYIFRMDSDDISRPTRFESQVSFMDTYKNIGICGMAISEFYEDGNSMIRSYPTDHDSLLGNMLKASPFAHPTVCFRGSTLKLLDRYSKRYHLCEDIDMWFRAAKLDVKFANLPDVGLDFRIQKNFFKRRSFSKAWSEFQVYFLSGYEVFGGTFKLAYPFLRLFSRLMPQPIIKFMYKYSLRSKLLN